MRGKCSLWQVIQSLKATGLFMPFLLTFHFIEFHQHISTPFVSPKRTYIRPPFFLVVSSPTNATVINQHHLFVGAYPNRSDDRPPWASWSPVMRNPADLQERSVDTFSPLMPWVPRPSNPCILRKCIYRSRINWSSLKKCWNPSEKVVFSVIFSHFSHLYRLTSGGFTSIE